MHSLFSGVLCCHFLQEISKMWRAWLRYLMIANSYMALMLLGYVVIFCTPAIKCQTQQFIKKDQNRSLTVEFEYQQQVSWQWNQSWWKFVLWMKQPADVNLQRLRSCVQYPYRVKDTVRLYRREGLWVIQDINSNNKELDRHVRRIFRFSWGKLAEFSVVSKRQLFK